MSVVLSEKRKAEEYMIAHATMPARPKRDIAQSAQVQGQERIWDEGLSAEVFETLAPLVRKQFGSVRKRQSERIDVEAERLRTSDPSRLYREEVGHSDILTSEEVVRLAQCIERGRVAATRSSQPGQRELIEAGELAKNRLIEANLRLVIHVARRYKGFEMDLMDLIQEGNLGLMHAVEKYDYRKGYRFSTYAIWWIRQAITRALTEQAQMIRVPQYKMDKIKR